MDAEPSTICGRPIDFSPQAVFEKLRSLKSKSFFTPETLPPILYRMLADAIREPLSEIFGRVLCDGDLPAPLRETIVTPIFKKGCRQLWIDNYGPVPQGSVACLVLEKLIVNHFRSSLNSISLTRINTISSGIGLRLPIFSSRVSIGPWPWLGEVASAAFTSTLC